MSGLLDKVKLGATKYINLYNPMKKEGFEGDSNIRSLIWLVLVALALYFAYRIKGGFDLLHMLAAFCCPVIYIAYAILITGGKGLFSGPISFTNAPGLAAATGAGVSAAPAAPKP